MTIYNKLIRDKVPEKIKQDGYKYFIKTLKSDEFKVALDMKLQEEIREYYKSEDISELADIVEVVYAILQLNNISIEEFEKIRLDKKEERGGFEKRLFLKRILDGK